MSFFQLLLRRLRRPDGPARPDGLRAEVARFLRTRWWPPSPLSETEYVDGVCRLLRTGPSTRAVARHLCREEEKWLGFRDTEPHELASVANGLRRIGRKHGSTRRT